MSLIDAVFFQTYHRQKEEDFPENFLSLHIPNGELELIDLAGEETFQEVEAIKAKAEGDRTAEEKRMLAAFHSALAELTMADVIPGVNLVVGDVGIVQSSHTQNFGEGTFKIASPKDIEALVEIYKQKAARLVDRYIEASMGIVGKAVFEE